MEWKKTLGQLTVSRLTRLASSAGLAGVSRMRKAKLVAKLLRHLDDALKAEALSLLRGEELRALALSEGVAASTTRKQALISLLLASEQETQELELGEDDLLLPDRGRLDLPGGDADDRGIELLPSRPGGASATLFFELLQLLRRPALSRAVLVSPDCNSAVLARLLSEGLDDLIETTVRWRGIADLERPLVTVILDGRRHGLDDTEPGGALVSLAQRLAGKLEIRLTPPERPLRAGLFIFEESRDDGPWLTGLVTSADLLSTAMRKPGHGDIEAALRVAGPLAGRDTPASVLQEWVIHLRRESRVLRGSKLLARANQAWAVRKVDYKLDFDTSHELRLKHLAEQLCRRGRHACPMFDPAALDEPPRHQRLALARSAAPWRQGLLLLDADGLGKTVEAGLVLSRELRRRRIYASSESAERRRALVVAPESQFGHWREELAAKFGLHATIASPHGAERGGGAHRVGLPPQIVICGPTQAATVFDDLQGFDILVVDEAHLYEEEVLSALNVVRATAEYCVVASGMPAQHDLADVLSLAALAAPDDAWDTLAALQGEGLFAFELGTIASRTRRTQLSSSERPRGRKVTDRFYALEPEEAEAYEELRRMRADYLRRSGRDTAWALVTLEQAFLSSPQALHAAVTEVTTEGPRPPGTAILDGSKLRDGSLAFVRTSSYLQRRVRRVRDALGERCRQEAPVGAKEAALLDVLSKHVGDAVVVLTQYRASAQRVAAVLERARICPRIEQLDDASSLRERLGVVARFRERLTRHRGRQGPAGVLVGTDAAVEQLDLHKTCSVLVNWDLPWNPQTIERRIARLQRWGQSREVEVINIASRSPRNDGWTMDTRVLSACRRLFDMADSTIGGRDALVEMAPASLEATLAAEHQVELSLIEPPDEEIVRRFEALMTRKPNAAEQRAAERVQELDRSYREQLADLWERVSYGSSTLEAARGYWFGRLQQSMLQGQVGVLCAPERKIRDCTTFHVVVGLRLLFEAALADGACEPLDDQYLVDDELIRLWSVAPGGQVSDWADTLLGAGLADVPQREADGVVGKGVLEYLVRQKRALETRALDAMPLGAWRRGAPPELDGKLQVVQRRAEAESQTRLQEIAAEWAGAKEQRLARLRKRRDRAVRSKADDAIVAAIDQCLEQAERREVHLRHEVLGTQLFVVTY